MQNAEDQNGIGHQSINDDIGRSIDDKLSCPRVAAWAAELRKFSQALHPLANPIIDRCGGARTIRPDMIENLVAIQACEDGPFQPQRPSRAASAPAAARRRAKWASTASCESVGRVSSNAS